jgi:hypothetical protein
MPIVKIKDVGELAPVIIVLAKDVVATRDVGYF